MVPYKTLWFFLVLMISIFGLALIVAIEPIGLSLSLDSATLLIFGGLYPPLVVEHQAWPRLLTAIWVHGSLLHLVFNSFALWQGGRIITALSGEIVFAAIFLFSGLMGTLATLGWSLYTTKVAVSVGASGAIMGLFGALWVLEKTQPAVKAALGATAWRVIVPSCIPLFDFIDYAGHVGGVLGGTILMWIIIKIKDRTPVYFTTQLMPAIIAGVLSLLTVFSGFEVSKDAAIIRLQNSQR